MSYTTLLNQSITIYPKSGYDKFGKPTSSVGTAVTARVQKTTKQRVLPNNSLVTIEAVVYVPAGTTVAIDDRVDYGSIKYKVFGRYDAILGNGSTHHIKLELIKWQI